MTKSFLILLLAIVFSSCVNEQWNLNKTIGWKPLNPEDYTVLYLKLKSINSDLNQLTSKTKIDNQVLQELRFENLGDVVEKDDSTETDLHFMVHKNYKKALKSIVSIAQSSNISESIIIYERVYLSSGKWNDQAIYTLQK